MGKHLGGPRATRTTAAAQARDLYDKIDGSRFPNLKQMLRGLRIYHVLSFNRQVSLTATSFIQTTYIFSTFDLHMTKIVLPM